MANAGVCLSPGGGSDAEDDDDELSVHSAVSNASDLEEDEDVEYLMLDMVNDLPPEMASRLMKNMRTKEKAVQDLLNRNSTLLAACNDLDKENKALANKLRDTEEATLVKAAAPAPEPETAPNVDMSYFQKMERGKEEKIMRLQKERDLLAMQARRLDEGNFRLEEALAQAQKELKKAAQQQIRRRPDNDASGRPAVRGGLYDEEERLFQQMQADRGSEVLLQKFHKQQEENKKSVSAALQALLREDLQRIERWSSDVSALMLAVDGLESQVRPSSKEKSGAKKQGKVAAPAAGKEQAAGSEQFSKVSSQLLDELTDLCGQLEDAEQQQVTLEQTVRGVHDGAEGAAVAMGLPSAIALAESEAATLREDVERARSVNVSAVALQLGQTEESIRQMLTNAPPGLFPAGLEDGLKEARAKVAQRAASLAELQSGALRGVEVLQSAHQAHRGELIRKTAEELQRSARAVEQPLERMRSSLRQQSEAVLQARQRVSEVSEEFSAAARRSATSSEAASGGADLHGAAGEALQGSLREVRSMAKTLINGLEQGGKALEGRMEKVLTALVGDTATATASSSSSGGGGGRPLLKTAADADEERRPVSSLATAESKNKKKKRKARLGETVVTDIKEEDEEEERPTSSPATAAPATSSSSQAAAPKSQPPSKPGKTKLKDDAEASLRAEFAAAFSGKEKKPKTRPAGSKDGVLSGAALLQELTSLKSDADALQARMANRHKVREQGSTPQAGGAGDEETSKPAAAAATAAPKARRKKMFA